LGLTHRIRKALAMIDVNVVDHLIVGETITSMAERSPMGN
jgi:DNA repair protein RadC